MTRSATGTIEDGRYRYLAPELFATTDTACRPSSASDCYAFAMTVLELATLERPFTEFDYEVSVAHASGNGARPRRPDNLGNLPSLAQNKLWVLLENMWAHNPLERPGLGTVKIILDDISSLINASLPA